MCVKFPLYFLFVVSAISCLRHRCWHFAPVDCISRLSGSVELTLRYTTPDIHCRHRRYECDGGINIDITRFKNSILATDFTAHLKCFSFYFSLLFMCVLFSSATLHLHLFTGNCWCICMPCCPVMLLLSSVFINHAFYGK